MNITFAWSPPLHKLLFSFLTPFTTFYRPTGAAAYRILFEFFSLQPLPFRIFVYLLLILNIWFVFRLSSRLSGSCEIGAMSTLLFSYHGRLSPVYLNNGTLYDVLCASLSLGLLLFYIERRQNDQALEPRHWIIYLSTLVVALNAKEMAACVPLLLLCYELTYHWPVSRRPRSVLLQLLPALSGMAIVLCATIAKTGNGSVMHGEPEYRMTFTVTQFLNHWRHLMTDLAYVKGKGLTVAQMIAIWAALLVVTALARKRSWAFFRVRPAAIIVRPREWLWAFL